MTTKKALAIGLLGASIVGLLAIGIKTKFFNKDNTFTLQTKADNQITDLTNTTWYINETPTIQDFTYSVSFTSNNENFTSLFCNTFLSTIQYSTTLVYNNNTWINTNYRTITFLGNASTTTHTQNLITWLKTNAIQIPITNLTNTSWKLNETLPTITAGQLNANINFYNNGNLYNTFKLGYNHNGNAEQNSISYGNYTYYKNSQWEWTQSDQTYTQSSKIIITGGTDSTNINLIIWLTSNANQYQEINTTLNTKWTFIDNPKSNFWNYEYNIIFTSNSNTCNKLVAGRTTKNNIIYAYKTDATSPYTLNQIYNGTTWANNNFKIIIITNGDDVTSLSLISFLTCNASGTSYTPIPSNPNDYDIENGNFVSLQSLMIQILTMPFTFISQAFNVTLWPNTAWEFNLSNFIMGLIAIGAILFIIKLFTSGFAIIGNYTQNRDNKEFKRSQTKLNKAKTKQIEDNKPKVTHTYIHKDKK